MINLRQSGLLTEFNRGRQLAKCSSLLLLAFVVTSYLPFLSSRAAEPATQLEQEATFWFVPHTHWEGAVFKTREEYLEMGLPNILVALNLLKTHPEYRFVLDQACYIKPFLERYPEEVATFQKYVSDGRLQIVGGLDVMPDVNMPSGESFVRQLLYGKGFFREKLGIDVTVGWQLDTFGNHPQIPQILRQAGINSFWFARGVKKADTPSEFIWRGLDGTTIPAFWTSRGYALTYASPKTLPEFSDFFKERFERLTPYSHGSNRVSLAGADVCIPEEHVPGLIQQFNQMEDAPFQIRIGVPTDFEKVVAARGNLPTIDGDFNPIFPGSYSSRIKLKQWTRDLERLLTNAEKLGALTRWLGLPTDDQMTWRAWEPMLFNQAHDLMAGVMTDHVYEDTLSGYEFSKRLVDELVETRLSGLSSKIDTRGEGVPLVVFNALGWERTDIAEVDVGFSDEGVYDVQILDSSGKSVPSQILSSKRDSKGQLAQAKIMFLAHNVPSMGYAVYRAVPRYSDTGSSSSLAQDSGTDWIENEFYRVGFNLATGEITSLLVKDGNWEALKGSGNVITHQEDHGDLWQLYKNLDAEEYVAKEITQAVPQPGKTQFSNEFSGEPGVILKGPVFSEFTVSHSFGEKGKFATTVRLYAGIPRVDIHTKLINQDAYVRYQALFPTSIDGGKVTHEIPFGAIGRPEAVEFPAQNWVDFGNKKQGVAVLNRGLPGNITTDGTMMLSLMRATDIRAYGFVGGYEQGVSSATGYEIGNEIEFQYALVPHAGEWQEARVYRDGLEFNNPLVVHKTVSHKGILSAQWSMLKVSHPNVVVSSVKSGKEGATVLRVYEAAGKASPQVKIKFQTKIVSAHEANLMEDLGSKLEILNNTLKFDLKPFEIKTFSLQLQPPKKG
ncbi:MAG: hypothetical protein GXP26_04355 [Planctomycetes bacterium]|nr:hypothetical protein [Planctomycetota bacterium]